LLGVANVIDLRTQFSGSMHDIESFVRFGQTEYRIVSGSKHLRNPLVERLAEKVNASVRLLLEFRVHGMMCRGAAKGVLYQWERDHLGSAPSAPPRSLKEFLETPVIIIDDTKYDVANVIRALANGRGGVHWEKVFSKADIPFVIATAGLTHSDATMDGFSTEASILPSIATATNDGLESLVRGVKARSTL